MTKTMIKTAGKVATTSTLLLLLNACVSTEPRLNAPHINLSSDTVFNHVNNNAGNNTDVINFGIDVSANESDSLENLAVLPGVRVRRVDSSGSAAAAKLKTGDIILAVNGVETNHPDTFNALLQNADANQALVIKARRDTTVFTTTLSGQSYAQANIEELYRADPIMSRAGYQTAVVNANGQTLTGARLMEVFADSPLPRAGLSIDDTVLTADGLAVESAQGLVNYFMSRDYGEKVKVQIIDAQNNLSVTTIKLWDPGLHLNQFSLWPLFKYESSLAQATTQFNLLKIGPISLFEFRRNQNENSYKLFTLFRFGTGTGQLVEDAPADQ